MSESILSHEARHLLYQLYHLCKTEIGDTYYPEFVQKNKSAPEKYLASKRFSDLIDKERFVYGDAKTALATFERAIKELYLRSCINIENQTIEKWVRSGFKWRTLPRAMLNEAIKELSDKQGDGFNVYLDRELRELIDEKYPALANTKICITNWGVMCARPQAAATLTVDENPEIV